MASDRDDLTRRWRGAKLGERRGGRVAVWVECAEGVDPRAEVLRVLCDLQAADWRAPVLGVDLGGEDRSVETTHDASGAVVSSRDLAKPKRRKRTKGGE